MGALLPETGDPDRLLVSERELPRFVLVGSEVTVVVAACPAPGVGQRSKVRTWRILADSGMAGWSQKSQV